jgi:hypothetical protein
LIPIVQLIVEAIQYEKLVLISLRLLENAHITPFHRVRHMLELGLREGWDSGSTKNILFEMKAHVSYIVGR